MTTSWKIHIREWDDPQGVALREAQQAEIRARYAEEDTEPGGPPAEVDAFLIAFDDTEPIGCGALRQLSEGVAEIKRMYVRPAHRGTGVATALLRGLEAVASNRGWPTLRLETGVAQPEAMRFYEREGYRRIPAFGPYIGAELSVCYELSHPSPLP